MPAHSFSELHTIPFYECNVNNRISIPMLINILILASEHQNENLGMDQTFLIDHYGIGWVVTSYSIHITELPQKDSVVKMTTRGTSYNRYFAFREFWLHDQDDNELVKVESIWVLMNEETRKITPINKDVIAPYQSENVRRIPRLPRPERIEPHDDVTSKEYQVRWSDIDFNGHVNNSRYPEWMLDSLPMEFLNNHEPANIDIRFENEVKYGNRVTSSVVVDSSDNAKIKTVHEIKSKDVLSASATIVWKEIQVKGND
ncbi:acyl-ACP thioesterase domain-containing protein [Lentilactobacillus otakiensis]|uniref:acyl-[acyl-carrier-protein] thioesterase n=1 Tax=Lentilactobacillus otakiensis TaxID=481720 RepID=UPI0031D9759E